MKNFSHRWTSPQHIDAHQHDKLNKPRDLISDCACCVCPCVRRTPLFQSHAKRAIGWDQPIFVVRSIAPLRIFMAAWGGLIFDRPTACHTNLFCFSIGSYPPEWLRLLRIVGRGGILSFPLCVMVGAALGNFETKLFH